MLIEVGPRRIGSIERRQAGSVLELQKERRYGRERERGEKEERKRRSEGKDKRKKKEEGDPERHYRNSLVNS